MFCLRRDGGFVSEEHLWAESLGNPEVVLEPGVVCDRCNANTLAQLDEALITYPPIAVTSASLGLRNKKGRLVSREFASGGVFPVETEDGIHVFFREAQTTAHPENGRWEFVLTDHLTGRQLGKVARAVLATGLEAKARKEGKAAVMLPQFDGVREAVLDGYDGYLMEDRHQGSHRRLEVHYRSQAGPPQVFGAWVDIRGVILAATHPSPRGVFPGDLVPGATPENTFVHEFTATPDRKKDRGKPFTWNITMDYREGSDREGQRRHISDVEKSLGKRGRRHLILPDDESA